MARLLYSDLNYILLGDLVHKSGMPLDEFTRKKLFTPLGLTTMGYKPDAMLKPRFARRRTATAIGLSAKSMIRAALLEASPATPACSPRPTTWPFTPRCFSTAAFGMASASRGPPP